jgi:hypothetical protein
MSLALGSPDGKDSAAAVVKSIVGVIAAEEPMMMLVTAGDPTHSYLMHKMDGDQCTLATQCNAGEYKAAYPNCGGIMPQPIPPQTTSNLLAPSDRDVVRAWIKQGAQSN